MAKRIGMAMSKRTRVKSSKMKQMKPMMEPMPDHMAALDAFIAKKKAAKKSLRKRR